MKTLYSPGKVALCLSFFLVFFALTLCAFAAEREEEMIHGGLVVQLGAANLETPIRLSRTGRHVVSVLDGDPAAVEAAQQALQDGTRYGLVTAERIDSPQRLPFTENIVNQVIVNEAVAPLGEILRVLTPGGRLVVKRSAGLAREQLAEAGFVAVEAVGENILSARKPEIEEMDAWTHSRHGADGNAVSEDTVVGPPERVRWVAAAMREVEGLVSAGGRNFYGGVLARDGFNGLRLWHRDLRKGEADEADFDFVALSKDRARPVASEKVVFVARQKDVVAFDSVTGEIAMELAGAFTAKELAHRGDFVVVTDEASVRAFSSENGEQLWKFEAGEPRNLVVGDGIAVFIGGLVRRGDAAEAVALDLGSGQVKWRNSELPFLGGVSRTVLYDDYVAFEVSTFDDHDRGNALHLVSTTDGKLLWDKEFAPGMNHRRQARAMFVDGKMWILHGGKIGTQDEAGNPADQESIKRVPTAVSALELKTGETVVTHPAGMAHCFPPVATPKFMFAGELDLTDLRSGEVVANRITKANCSQENGWVPANGLVYTTPKHCTCWPMLRGYVGMAPKSPEVDGITRKPLEEVDFVVERGSVLVDPAAPGTGESDWPHYRNDAVRSGSTVSAGPASVKTLWTRQVASSIESEAFAALPKGPVLHDWRENPYVKGPVTAPTIANGRVYVARPDAHHVVSLDADSGEVRWSFTADGRVDTPPTIHRGLCLFGTHGGSVFALRADTGETVWRLRAGLHEERIVAYGQVESAWPVPASVLVLDEVAYFVAGRQAFADGGVLVFAVDPMTGARKWVRRIDTLPQQGYYENSGLEFDAIDVVHAEGDDVAMSRWIFSRDGEEVSVDKWAGFAKLSAGGGEVWVPRGAWSYGARHVHRFPGEARRRPLVAFRDNTVFGARNGTTELFRRDFDLAGGEVFDGKWITGWEASKTNRDGGKPYRSYRLAENAAWLVDYFTPEEEKKKEVPIGTQLYNDVYALALAGDGRLYAAHKDGRLKVISTADGSILEEAEVPPPAWDGLAIAGGRLYLTTQTGDVVCLGER